MTEDFHEESTFDQLNRVAPSTFTDKMLAIPPFVLEMSSGELEREGKFTAEQKLLLKRLRASFWTEADRAINTKKTIMMLAVYEGFCDKKYFLRKVVGNSFCLAYILIRPGDYQTIMQEMLVYGLEIQREILDLPIYDHKGNVDSKLLNLKHNIIESMHNRLKGTPVNRTQIHQTVSALPETAKYDGLPEADIKARIRELESK